jgi:dTDP-4-amino-4,6-dideoxygalactose transaminase
MIYPVYHSSPYASLGNSSSFPVTEEVSLNSVHLPSSTELSEAEVAHVAKEFVAELTTLSE